MLTQDQIIPELLKQCPEFKPDWEAYTKWMDRLGKAGTHGTAAVTVVIALLRPYAQGRTEGLPRYFTFLEYLITNGDEEVRTVVAENYLQQLQFSLLGRKCGPELMADWMQPQVRHLWNELWRAPRFESVSKKISKLHEKKTEYLREYTVSLSPKIGGEAPAPTTTLELGMRTKFGGNPKWAQNDAGPTCYFCKRPMTFVAQIDSLEYDSPSNPLRRERHERQWMFGDVGMIYVFFCFYCQTTHSVYQSG